MTHLRHNRNYIPIQSRIKQHFRESEIKQALIAVHNHISTILPWVGHAIRAQDIEFRTAAISRHIFQFLGKR